MPLPPEPFVLECPSCRWSKLFRPNSDAFFVGRGWFDHCPICNGDTLERRQPTMLELMPVRLGALFGRQKIDRSDNQ